MPSQHVGSVSIVARLDLSDPKVNPSRHTDLVINGRPNAYKLKLPKWVVRQLVRPIVYFTWTLATERKQRRRSRASGTECGAQGDG